MKDWKSVKYQPLFDRMAIVQFHVQKDYWPHTHAKKRAKQIEVPEEQGMANIFKTLCRQADD